MRVGLMIGSDKERSRSERVAGLVDDARAVDRAGFASLWLPQIPGYLDAIALFDSGGHAATAASIWNETARTSARQRMVVLLGLAPVFDGLSVAAEGSRVHARLHIGADKREGLAEKLLAVLQLVAKARR